MQSAATPPFGILSRVLARSPVVQSILPFRMGPGRDGVVIVKESSIELYELGSGHLFVFVHSTPVSSKPLSAAVLPCQVAASVSSVSDYRSSPQIRDGSASAMAIDSGVWPISESDTLILVMNRSMLYITCGDRRDEFIVVKSIELRDAVGTVLHDQEALSDDESRDSDLYDSDSWPDSDSDCSDEDIAARIKALGKSVDVEPSGHAVLVSAYQNIFQIIELRSSGPGTAKSVSSSHQLEVQGVILHAKFLYITAPSNPVLFSVFFIDESGNPKLSIYEWQTGRPLDQIRTCCVMPLPAPLTTPMFMVAIRHESSLVFIADVAVHWMRAADIVSANLIPSTTSYPTSVIATDSLPVACFYPSAPQRSRLLAIPALQKTIEHKKISRFHDYFYLAFDSGDIYIVAISSIDTIEIVHYARVPNDVGPGFMVVEGDGRSGLCDLVFTGGDMNCGGAFKVQFPPGTESGTESVAACGAQFKNWAPVFDCCVLHTADPFRDRLFVTSGFRDRGTISQIRHGIEGEVIVSGPKFKGATDLFALSHPSYGGQLFVLLGFPWQSRLVATDTTCSALREITSAFPHGLASQTVFAQALPSGNVLVISPLAVSVFDLLSGTVLCSVALAAPDSFNAVYRPIVDVSADGTVVVLTQRLAGRDSVFAFRVGNAGADVEIHRLPSYVTVGSDVSVLKLGKIGEISVCVVGTHEPALYACEVDVQAGLAALGRISDLRDRETMSIPESLVTFAPPAGSATRLLVGLRDGVLLYGELRFTPSSGISFASKNKIRLGFMPLKLRAVDDLPLVFGLSGALWRIDMAAGERDWLKANPVNLDASEDKSITALSCISSPGETKKSIASLVGDRLTFIEIGRDPTECVSSAPIYGSPRRLLYIDHLHSFAVACAGTSDQLQFVDPLRMRIESSTACDTLFGQSEEVFCLCEWEIVVADKIYKYLAVGSGVTGSAPRADRGRAQILRVQRAGTDGSPSSPAISRPASSTSLASLDLARAAVHIDVKRKFGWTAPEPILALAPFQKHSLIYGTGSRVCLRTLDVGTLKFGPELELVLRSPVVSLSAEGDVIYASTRNNSVLAIAFEDGKLVFIKSDPVTRSMLHHQTYSDNFVIGCDKDRNVFGLYRPEGRQHLLNMSLQFKFVLPTAISRLRLARFTPVRDHPDPDDDVAWRGAPSRAKVRANQHEQAVVGAGINGAVYGFQLLSEDEYDRLSLHFRRVIREICRHLYSPESKFERGGYPLQLYAVPREYGIVSALADVRRARRRWSGGGRFARRRWLSVDESEMHSWQDGLAGVRRGTSLRYIDGDVLAYLTELLRSLGGEDEDEDDDDAMSEDGEPPHSYYEYARSRVSMASHLQPQDWIDRVVGGMVI